MEIDHVIKDILVTEIFVEIPADQMRDNDNLRNIYGLDSIGFVELRVQCEERFGITISDDDFNADNFSSLGSVVALVARLLPENGQRATTSGERS